MSAIDLPISRQRSGPVAVVRALLRAMLPDVVHRSLTRVVRATFLCAVVGSVVGSVGCPAPEAGAAPAGLPGSEGRARYIVTMDVPAVDLAEYRALQKDQPDAVASYVDKKRAELAAAQAGLDGVVRGIGGRIVGRWWMTGQATIEVAPAGVATVRATQGVKSIVADTALQ